MSVREILKPWSAVYRPYLSPLLFLGLDYIAIIAAEHGAFFLHDLTGLGKSEVYRIAPLYVYAWIPFVFLLFLAQSKAYRQMQPFIDTVREIFYSIGFGVFACVLALYFTASSLLASRLFVLLFWILMIVAVYAVRILAGIFLKKHHLLYEPVLLIGAGKTAERALHFFEEDLGYRYDVLGIVDDAPISMEVAGKYPLYGSMEEAEDIVKKLGCKTVIITAPGMTKEKLQDVIAKVQPHVRNISYVPDLIGTPMAGVEAQVLFSEEILMLQMRNNLALRRNRLIKRLFDLAVTMSVSIVLIPFLALLGIIIKLDSKGSVFYNASRIGQNGRTFTCYKFRSMYSNADEILQDYLQKNPAAAAEWKEYAKLRDYDPRVTRAGAWLRKYSLDELPQAFNVFLGDMSLVGPRPYLPREREDIGTAVATITQAMPGITGYWQVSGRNDVSFQERINMDVWYVRNWSVWIDLMYLAKTAQVVFGGRGAY